MAILDFTLINCLKLEKNYIISPFPFFHPNIIVFVSLNSYSLLERNTGLLSLIIIVLNTHKQSKYIHSTCLDNLMLLLCIQLQIMYYIIFL